MEIFYIFKSHYTVTKTEMFVLYWNRPDGEKPYSTAPLNEVFECGDVIYGVSNVYTKLKTTIILRQGETYIL